jgi:tRNA 2-thiouridine synthesizing protein A
MTDDWIADATLDCSGLYCPQPVIRTAAQVKEMAAGQVLKVLATDPGFQIDLPAWCLGHRHEFLGLRRDGPLYVGYLRVQENERRSPALAAQVQVRR